MNILVTGGAGFIGSYVVDILIDMGHTVSVVDNLSGGTYENINPKAVFIKGDIGKKKISDSVTKNMDIVYHLAADPYEGFSIFSPVFNARNQYLASLQLLVSCINNNVGTFINVSSMAAYGLQKELPLHEEQMPNPIDPYGLHKFAFENVLKMYADIHKFNYVTIVPHNVYGIRQKLEDPYRNVIAIFMNRIKQKKPLVIYGDGSQKRAFTYIDDCAPYIVSAGFTKTAFGQKINIGAEDPISINDLAKLVLQITKSSVKIVHTDKRINEVQEAYCSSQKAKKILGYKTNVDLRTGLTYMWKWISEKKERAFIYNKKTEIQKKVHAFWKNSS